MTEKLYRTHLLLCSSTLYFFLGYYAHAFNSEKKTSQEEAVKNSFWTLQASLQSFSMYDQDRVHRIIGNGAKLSLGKGEVQGDFFYLLQADYYLGPYEPGFNRQLDVDFTGSGLSFIFAVNIDDYVLRTPLGSHGFLLGLTYYDLFGVSSGENRLFSGNEVTQTEILDEYKLSVSNSALQVGFFLANFKQARLDNNTRKNLRTRRDGTLIQFLVEFPIYTVYGARYSFDSGREQKDKGRALNGYAFIVSFTALLGV